MEIEFFEEEAVGRVLIVLRTAVELHQILGVAARSVGRELEIHTSHVRGEILGVSVEQFVPRLGRRGIHNAFHAVCQLRCVAGSALCREAVEARATAEEKEYFRSAIHLDTLVRGAERTAHGNDLNAGVVVNRLELAVERTRAVSRIGGVVGVEFLTGDQAEDQMEFICAVGCVARGDHTVGSGSKIATRVLRAGFIGEVHPANALIEIQIADIVEHLLALCAVESGGVEVLDEDAAEVQEATETTAGAVAAAGVDILRATRPKRFFVELNFVVHHAAEEACAERTVTDGQGVFHPRVRHPHGRLLVPQGVATFGREATDLRERILPTSVLRQLLAIGRVGQRRLVVRFYEIERVVRVARVPETELFACTGTTPLVETLRLVLFLGDFVATDVSGARDECQLDSLGFVGRSGDVRIVARHRHIVALVRAKHERVLIADQEKLLSLFGKSGCAELLSVAVILQESFARFELDAHILRCGLRTEHGFDFLRDRHPAEKGKENEE